MNSHLLPGLDLDDDDLRRRFDAIATRATMPVLDPLADLRRARDARSRRRLTQAGAGLVAAAAVSVLVIGNLSGGDIDAGRNIANDRTPTTATNDAAAENAESPEAKTFREDVGRALSRPTPRTAYSSAIYALGETSLVTYQYPWTKRVALDIRAAVSREVLEWNLAKDTSSVFVGDGMAERGTWPSGADAYIFDQPDGDVVLVMVDGPSAQAPSDEVIATLLTELDLPVSTLTPAQVWQDTMVGIGTDHLVTDNLSFGNQSPPLNDLPSVLAETYRGNLRPGVAEWQAQTLSADTPDCPPGFTNCGTMQIAGETFLAKYVATGDREGWLYLERDHGDVRAQIIMEPFEGAWSLPLAAAAELLLDDRWSTLDPESAVPYPAP